MSVTPRFSNSPGKKPFHQRIRRATIPLSILLMNNNNKKRKPLPHSLSKNLSFILLQAQGHQALRYQCQISLYPSVHLCLQQEEGETGKKRKTSKKKIMVSYGVIDSSAFLWIDICPRNPGPKKLILLFPTTCTLPHHCRDKYLPT